MWSRADPALALRRKWRLSIRSGQSRRRLLLRSSLDRPEDRGYLAFENCEFEIDHAPSRMQDHIDRCAQQQRKVSANCLAHPPLDAIAIDRLAHCLADRYSDPCTIRRYIAHRTSVWAKRMA